MAVLLLVLLVQLLLAQLLLLLLLLLQHEMPVVQRSSTTAPARHPTARSNKGKPDGAAAAVATAVHGKANGRPCEGAVGR